METQSDPFLESEIKRRITERGPITFAEFMALALYDPEHGYYCTSRQKIGPRGDFLTSPETHPVFGALVALQLEQMWRLLGRPAGFAVVEMGAGSGGLCRSILEYARNSLPELYQTVDYVLVDRQRDAACLEAEDCARQEHPGKVRRVLATGVEAPLAGVVGCFLSNELVDAFPVHRVAFENGRLKELFVGLSPEGDFVEVPGEPSTPELSGYFDALGLTLVDGSAVEVNLEGVRWMASVARALEIGFVLTIDYGYPVEELYSPARRVGSLMCYYRHTYGQNPYVRIGAQDMTTHVDFTSLVRAGLRHGLKFTGMLTQTDFLTNLGLDAFVSAMAGAGLPSAVFFNNKFALRRLTEAHGLGKFRVLIQHKGVVEPSLDCLNPCNDRKREMVVRGKMDFIPLMAPAAEA